MPTALLTVARDDLRRELAADLGRGGYVLHAGAGDDGPAARYFDKALVLSRPGLLTRAATLLADLLPAASERIAVTSVPSAALGTALSQATGVPLLLGSAADDGGAAFHGESYRGVKAVLLEDVVFTGARATAGARALAALGADVLGVVCLLDRDCGAALRLAEEGFSLRSLFTEGQLLALSHGAGV
jgi:orotate phosphoribosyltransferase